MTRTTEGEITLYGLRLEYNVYRGGGGYDSEDLHASWPSDAPEVTLVIAEVVDRARWIETCADFDLDTTADPMEFVREQVWDDFEGSVLRSEGLT